jgi:hypothetical protein
MITPWAIVHYDFIIFSLDYLFTSFGPAIVFEFEFSNLK